MSDSPYIHDVTQETFADQVLQASKGVPVLVDFWADWCAPCHMLTPILSKLADEYQGQFIVCKVNSDEQQALAAQYGIRSLPTVKLFKNGQIVDEFMGVQPESAIRALLEQHIERESDKVRKVAAQALRAGDTPQALQLLQQAAAMDPGNARVKIDLARVLMLAGESERAEIILDDLKGDEREQPEVKALKAQLGFARIAAEEPDTAGLAQRVASEPENLTARYRLAAHRIVMGDFEGAMELLLEIMKRDRKFEHDAGRKGLLAVFDILGSGELVNRYRSKMFNYLH